MDELSAEKQPNPADRIKKYRWPKGTSGNPKGRPISPITRIKEMFKENPDDFDEWLGDYLNDRQNRKHVVEMLDGKPVAKTDITTNGKDLPQPLLMHVQRDDGTETAPEAEKED